MFIISTPRLQLIPLNSTQLWMFRSDPELSLELLGIEPDMLCTEDSMGNDIEGVLDFFEEQLKDDPFNYPWHTTWHIVLKEENKRIGRMGFGGIPHGEHGLSEVGYAIDAAYRNKGYMTEALQAAMYWAFQHIELQVLVAETYANNEPSHKVLKKCGFGIIDECNEAGNILWGIRNGTEVKPVEVGVETHFEEMILA